MGPIQGAIVNWFGHKLGYSNFNNGDHSKNSSPWGFLLLGELFQNNHHYAKNNANFAQKWFELDPTYLVMRGLHLVGIIKLKKMVPVAVSATEVRPMQSSIQSKSAAV
jgi:stearoyl-CoA desaturase (delta-9 desaturase)